MSSSSGTGPTPGLRSDGTREDEEEDEGTGFMITILCRFDPLRDGVNTPSQKFLSTDNLPPWVRGQITTRCHLTCSTIPCLAVKHGGLHGFHLGIPKTSMINRYHVVAVSLWGVSLSPSRGSTFPAFPGTSRAADPAARPNPKHFNLEARAAKRGGRKLEVGRAHEPTPHTCRSFSGVNTPSHR